MTHFSCTILKEILIAMDIMFINNYFLTFIQECSYLIRVLVLKILC